jgi:hypothetical protein
MSQCRDARALLRRRFVSSPRAGPGGRRDAARTTYCGICGNA